MKLPDNIFNFWYWKAVVNHKLFFTKVSVRFCTSLPVRFQEFQKKNVLSVLSSSLLSKKCYKSVCHRISWYCTIYRLDLKKASDSFIAFHLAIPTNLEFLVVVSSVLCHISQVKGTDFLLCGTGPTPELLCPVWGFTTWGVPKEWKGPCRGQSR